jgi:hypothetical protein
MVLSFSSLVPRALLTVTAAIAQRIISPPLLAFRHLSPEQLSSVDAWPSEQNDKLSGPQLPVLQSWTSGISSACVQRNEHASLSDVLMPDLLDGHWASGDVDLGQPFTPRSTQCTTLEAAMWQACLSPAGERDLCTWLSLTSPISIAEDISLGNTHAPLCGVAGTLAANMASQV